MNNQQYTQLFNGTLQEQKQILNILINNKETLDKIKDTTPAPVNNHCGTTLF